MNLFAIYSKTGKGVQETSGKTSHLSRADRAVLAAIDGRTPLAEVQSKFEKLAGPKFEALIAQLDKDGFIREVSSGSQPAAAPRAAPPAAKAPAPKEPPSPEDTGALDFTQLMSAAPKAPAAPSPKPPPMDQAAAARAEAERKAKEQQATDYKSRQEAEARAKAEAAARAKAEAEAKARAAAEAAARAKAEAEARARAAAEGEAKARAEAEAKVKAAREAAVRMATEVKAKAEAEAKAVAEAAERERQAAEERARKEAEDKARLEAELNAKLDAERKAREDAERRAAEAAEQARKELEEKAKRDAEEMRKRLEEQMRAEMEAKLEAERKAREEEDRRRREEDERRRKEEEERRAKEEAERRAREEAERKAREEEERKRRDEEARRRKEEEERRAKEEAERKAREEEERKRREEEDRRRREEDERRAKEEAERKAREEEDRKRRAKEEAEGKAKEDAERKAKQEAERKEREEAEKKRREEEERRRKAEDERRAQEEAERREREEQERRQQEEEERKRKAKEAQAAKQAAERKAKAVAAGKGGGAADDDIEVTDEDLEMDDIKKDQKALSRRAQEQAREREQLAAALAAAPRPKKWGKPVAIGAFAVLLGGLGVVHVMPLSTADYEKAASDALGAPVKIGSARLSLFTGVEIKFDSVSVGDRMKARLVRGSPEIGSLFGPRKSFSSLQIEGAAVTQEMLGDALLGKVAGENFRVGRIRFHQLNVDGPLKLAPFDIDATVASDGTLQSVKAEGPDKLVVQLSPRGGEIAFDISSPGMALPIVPALTLSEFHMKGTANRSGVTSSEFDGRAYDGVISGTARLRWGANWQAEGEVRVRGLKVAVFAPALVSEGKVEGRATYTMSAASPAALQEGARMQGEFKIEKGVLGSFDLTRALQSGGSQSTGRTVFNELTGQGIYDRGTVQITNVAIAAGAMNAGAAMNVDANGGLSGRVVAEVKTPSQTLRATLNLSGKVQEPVIRK